MVINEEIKSVINSSAFLSLVTLGADGTPHPIVAGKGEVVDDTVVFGIYKNGNNTGEFGSEPKCVGCGGCKNRWSPEGLSSYRHSKAKDKRLVFTPERRML